MSTARRALRHRIRMNYLNDDEQNEEERLFGELTVAPSGEFQELRVNGTVYDTVSCKQPFALWEYLAHPASYAAALADTPWKELEFMRQSLVLKTRDAQEGRPALLAWKLVVNQPIPTRNGFCLNMHRRVYMMEFTAGGKARPRRSKPGTG